MRHTLLKLTGLMVAVMLALTGCNLIEIDPLMQLDEDFAALNKDFAAVVVDYDGGQLTKGDAIGTFVSQYSYYSQLYSMFGMSMTSDIVESLKQEALESEVQAIAVDRQFTERGLTLSEEKAQEVEDQTAENYQEVYDYFYGNTSAKDSEELRQRQTEYNMLANGYSRDLIHKGYLNSAKYELVHETVENEVEDLTDEDLQKTYDDKVAEDESTYSSASAFESAMTSEDEVVTWMPEGYRIVKHILVKPADDVLTAVSDARTALSDAQAILEGYESELDALTDDDTTEDAEAAEAAEAETAEETEPARTVEAVQADIDAVRADVEAKQAEVDAAVAACLDSVKDKTDEIYSKLEAGEDFAALIAEYGEDPGMQNEPTAARGYYVSSYSANWDKNFTAGAMALENVGDYTTAPIISSSGVHIIRYESDVTPGAVPLEEVRDALHDKALEDAREEHFNTELQSWIDALNAVYHVDAFNVG